MPTVREGEDIVVFASGVMVSKAVLAADALAEEGISLKVVNVSTVKPFPKDKALAQVGSKARGVIVAEEHSVIGGVASAVLEAFAGKVRLPFESIGVNDSFGTSAHGYEELLAYYGLTEKEIVGAARRILGG
jgi:transketolase